MTAELERRDFLQGTGLLMGAVAAATVTNQASFAQGASPTAPQIGGKAMAYTPKPLSIDPKSINGISEKVLVSHYENNYVGAVKRLNAIGMQLAELDFAKAPNFVVNGLKREELIAANSMILHEIYFDGLGGGGTPKNPLIDGITRDFGGLERWRAEFSAMGKAQGGGSGWVILAYSPRDKRLVNQWAADHTTTLAGAGRCWCSICTNTPITWITARRPRNTSTPIWKRSAGTMRRSFTTNTDRKAETTETKNRVVAEKRKRNDDRWNPRRRRGCIFDSYLRCSDRADGDIRK
jgi:superoxide dismutase, Fe-Mn family